MKTLREMMDLIEAAQQGVAEGSTTRGGFGGSAGQAQHEIEWLKNKIETLKPLLAKKPSVARQIKDLERQIRERELAIAYQKEGVAEMDKSGPQPGRDGRVSHSTYGSRDKGGSKGPEKEAQPITAKKVAQDALDILKKQGVAEEQLEETTPDAMAKIDDLFRK